jgi:hypothetical protein
MPDWLKVKLPSDLSGVTVAKYRQEHAGGLVGALGAACSQISDRIKDLGLRTKISSAVALESHRLVDFNSRIAGSWWEFLDPVNISALGFLSIEKEAGGVVVRIHARAYKPNGNRVADWETITCGAAVQDRRLLYMWRGRYRQNRGKSFEGYGEIIFHEKEGPFTAGHGLFTEPSPTEIAKTVIKTGEVYRCTAEEIEIMQSGDDIQIASLAIKKLKVWEELKSGKP